MMQVARPVNMIGIIPARMSQKFFAANLPLFFSSGRSSICCRAASELDILSPKVVPCALTKIRRNATRRAIPMAASARTTLNFRLFFLLMAYPPDFLRRLMLDAEHVSSHQIVGEILSILKICRDLSAAHNDETVGKLHYFVQIG